MSRFDIVEGHYLFCCLHHSGQWDPLYARMCRIGAYFRTGLLWSAERILTDTSGEYWGTQQVYRNLCEKHGVIP